MTEDDAALMYAATCTRCLHELIEKEIRFPAIDDGDRLILSQARTVSDQLATFSRALTATVKRHEKRDSVRS